MFEDWIVNPNSSSMDDLKLVPDTIRADNEKIYLENVKRVESELPPLPHMDVDDEKVEAFEDLIVAQQGNSSTSSLHSMLST